MTSITVAIPTYNRPTQLREQVKVLHKIIPSHWRVLIIDNASEMPAVDVLVDEIPGFQPGQIKIHRNPYNIGLSGNIIRCFELPETEWVWTVSDDDTILSEAAGYIERVINERSDVSFICLGSNLWPVHQDLVVENLDGFFEKMPTMVNLTLLTSGVYHIPSIAPYFRFGYLYGYSLCPFLAMLLLALRDRRGKFFFSGQKFLEAEKPTELSNTWSFLTTSLAITSLLELPLNLTDRNFSHFARLLQSYVASPKLALTYIEQTYAPEQREMRRHIMRQVMQRNFYIRRINAFRALKMHFFIWILTAPRLIRRVLLRLLGIKSANRNDESQLFGRI